MKSPLARSVLRALLVLLLAPLAGLMPEGFLFLYLLLSYFYIHGYRIMHDEFPNLTEDERELQLALRELEHHANGEKTNDQ